MSLPEIQSFEVKHGISLPLEYEWFLTHLGNGGAGPHYGLLPLDKSVTSKRGRFLATPFPHQSAWNETVLTSLTPEEEEKFDDLYISNDLVTGSLEICHEGCGHVVRLVVSGKEKGTIWGDSRVSDQGIYPYAGALPDKQRITFLEWYQSWLIQSLNLFSKA